MYVTAFNTSSGPVTVDAEGRQISAQDWGTANTTVQPGKDALDAGTLVVVEVPDDGHPDAVAARDRTAAIAERFSAFDALEKEHLAEVAADAGIAGAEDAHKRHLTHALAARLDVEVPEPPPAEPATAEQPPDEAQQPSGEPVSPETPGDAPAKQTSRRRAGRE